MLFQNLTGTVHEQYSTGTVRVISCDPPCKVVYVSLHTTNTHAVNRMLHSLHGGSLEIMLTVPLSLGIKKLQLKESRRYVYPRRN